MKIIYPKIVCRGRDWLTFLVAVPVPKSVFTEAYGVLLEVLIDARREVGLTQVELAARLGRPQPFVSYVESGERRLDVIEFCAFAQAMGLDPELLFSRVAARLPERLEI